MFMMKTSLGKLFLTLHSFYSIVSFFFLGGGGGGKKDGNGARRVQRMESSPPPRMVSFYPILAPPRMTGKIFLPHPGPLGLGPRETSPHPTP